MLLTYSRCGRFLLSYTFTDSLRELAFDLQIWRVAASLTAGATTTTDPADGHLRQHVPHAVALFATAPLFVRADFFEESTMGCLLDGSAIHVSLWEPPDSGCLVVFGSLDRDQLVGSQSTVGSSPRGRGRNVHVTIVPTPYAAGGTLRPTLYAPPTSTGALPYSLNALHFFYSVVRPFPRPSPQAFTSLGALCCQSCSGAAGGLPLCYSLFLNTGDSLKQVVFGIRPVGEGPTGTPTPSGAAPPNCHLCAAPRAAGPWHTRAVGAGCFPFLFQPCITLACGETAAHFVAGRAPPMGSAWECGGGFRGSYALGDADRLLRSAADARAYCGGIGILSMSSLDVELVLPQILRGTVRDYDMRVCCATEVEERRLGGGGGRRGGHCSGDSGAAGRSNSRGCQLGLGLGRFVTLLCYVDHQLPLSPTAEPPPLPSPREDDGGASTATASGEAEAGDATPTLPPAPPPEVGGQPARPVLQVVVQPPVRRTFGAGDKRRKVTNAQSSESSVCSSSSGSSISTGSGGKIEPSALLPWEAPTLLPPIALPPVTFVSDTEGLSSPVRTRTLFIYDSLTGAVRVITVGKCPPSQQPGLDDLLRPRRTLATLTASALAALRLEGPSPSTLLSVRESTNEALLKRVSLKFLLNPILPSAVVL